MSLRTVAADTPSPAVLVTVWEPTGWAVSTYCSTMARRMAALRSSSSVTAPMPSYPESCPESLVGTQCYRVPTRLTVRAGGAAPASRRRVVTSDASKRPALVKTTRPRPPASPATITKPRPSSSPTVSARAPSGEGGKGAPARSRIASVNDSSARPARSSASEPASAGAPASICAMYRSGVRTFHQRRPPVWPCAAQPIPRYSPPVQ